MSNGDGTTEPVVIRVVVRVPVAAESKEGGNPWKKGWRSIFLFAMTVALVLLGIAFWLASAVGKEDARLEADTSQLIGVFSTDPNTVIHLTADVFWHDVNGYAKLPFEQVYVSATVPNPKSSSAIFVTSTLQPSIATGAPGNIKIMPDKSYDSAVFYSGAKPFPVLGPPQYVTEIPLKDIEQSSSITQYGAPVGLFELPQITQESHGSFFAHLPEIGIYSPFSGPLPYLISERTSSSQEQLIEGPEPKNLFTPTADYASLAPSQYQAPPGQHLQTIYWQPASLTTMEILEEVKPEVENATVDSIVPDGSLRGGNYVWQGQGFLEPTMNLTNQDAAASRSTWSFVAGIAFGVAAGTFVAYIQEEDHPLLTLLARLFKRSWPIARAQVPSRRSEADNDHEALHRIAHDASADLRPLTQRRVRHADAQSGFSLARLLW